MFRSNLFTDDLNTVVESFIDDMFSVPAETFKKITTPTLKTDIKEFEDSYTFQIDLPGYEKEDLKVELKEGFLTVTAQKQQVTEETNEGKYIRRERYTGLNQRSFHVGEAVKQEDIRAAFKDGVLTLTFPKEKPEAEKDFSITIE